MQDERAYWPTWAQFLHHRGMEDIAAGLFDSAGPLNVLLAQIMHAGKPFLHQALPGGQWQALADLLEDPEESRSFAAFLREEVVR